MAILRHDDARQRRAHLAVEPAFGACEGRGRGADVHVVENHCRRLPTELERAARDAFAAQRRDATAGRGRAGERDLVDTRVRHEQFRHFTVGRHDVEHAGRQPDLLGNFREHVPLARRFGRRLEHHRAAREERGTELVTDERHRRVPRDDRADHADRLAYQEAELSAASGRALFFERIRVGERGIRRERTRADPTRVLRRLVEHARLARPQLREHIVARLQPCAHCAQILGPLGMRESRPRPLIEREPRRRNGARHVVGRGLGHRVVHVFGTGIDHIDRRVGRRLHPFAADEELIGVRNRGCCRASRTHVFSPLGVNSI